jgi:two-component system phosphate regulon sensor histidine kinase PhoR
MIRRGIKWRLTITYLLITLIIMSTFYFSLTKGLEGYLTKTLENRLVTHARVFSHYAELTFLGNDLAQRFGEDVNVRVRILDYRGMVVGDSAFPSNQIGEIINTQTVQKALAGEIARDVALGEGKQRVMNVSAPLIANNSIIGVVNLSTSLDEIDSTLSFFRMIFYLTTLLSIVLAFGVGSYLAKTVTEPLREVTVAAHELSRGDFDYQVRKRHNDEVGILADTFNLLSRRLKETIEEISGERNKLSAVLTSIADGVIAVDRDGRFLLINPAAEQMFGISLEQLSDQTYWDAGQYAQINEMFTFALEQGGVISREVVLDLDGGQRVVRAHMAPIQGKEDSPFGVAGVFRDITELQLLERRRVEFLSNVSHELRTPLTTIKGFAVTLQDELGEQHSSLNRYVDIIDREVDRLSRLVSDLMDTSLAESGKIKLDYQKVSLTRVVEQAFQQFVGKAKEHGIKLNLNLPDKEFRLIGDEDRLTQVFINLIDNSIKYTPKGGTVFVSAEEDETNFYVEIRDTGIGISEEDLPHLFERFYRVEKTRSRKYGGTGLGLSIVQAIVAAHHGRIDVESKSNQGTIFKVVFPKNN